MSEDTNMVDISITEYTTADRASCIQLLSNIFPGTSNEETFRWRFECNLQHSPLIICAKDGDRVVSFNSWLPWEFSYNNEIFLGYQSGESATYPEYRRKGIWGKVLCHADEIARTRSIAFLFGFPSHMSYRAFYHSGYYPIGIFPYRIRLMNPFDRRSSENTDYDLGSTASNTLREYNKITPVDDSDYQIWRYLKNPKQYLVCKFAENNNKAVFILRPTTYHNKRYHVRLKELILLDCHFTSYNEFFVKDAFRHIDKTFAGCVSFVRSFINENTDRGRAIRRHFHLEIGSRHEILCVKPILTDLTYATFLNHNNWDIMPHVIDEM